MVQVEPLRPGDYAALSEIRRMAFSGDPVDPAAPHLPEDRFSCIYDGDRIIASARTRDFHQWFGGRAVKTGGLSGVVIVTDRRREGLGKAVVSDALTQMRARGEVFSSLFATSAALYRSLGYEIAGRYGTRRVALADLPASAEELIWQATRFDDPAVEELVGAAGRAHDGWLVVGEAEWRNRQHFLNHPKPTADIYLGHRGTKPVAAVGVQYTTSETYGFFSLAARVCCGIDDDATREAIAFSRRHGTTATHIDFHLPPHLLEQHIDPRRIEVVDSQPFMSRITDVVGALADRGWNPQVAGTVDLHVEDPMFADNTGPWQLHIEGGAATVEPGGDGRARFGIDALSAWYTGEASPARLRARGHADLDDGDAALLAAFVSGGGPPSLVDYF